jgi:hypothetical protein
MGLRDQDWPVVYELMESTEERTGLLPAMDVCATREAAVMVADERLGRYLPYAQEWQIVSLSSPENQEWQREILHMGTEIPDLFKGEEGPMPDKSRWQHIMASPLIGAHSDPQLKYPCMGSRVGAEAG